MKRRLAIGCLVLPVIAWLVYTLAGRALAAWMAQRWGALLLRAGDGKFTDAALFVQHRLFEATWLLTLGVGLLAVAVALGALAARRLPRLWQWIPFALTGFVGLNVWLGLGMSTCLFWCLFWSGKAGTDNLTQFHIKLLLLDESAARVNVVLGGSSQTRAEIDPALLNRRLMPGIFTTELHFPGSYAYDLLFLDRELASRRAEVIVCYLSEANFFTGGLSDGFPFFFSFGDWPDFARLGGKAGWRPRAMGYAVLGSVLPVFRLREALAYRVLGGNLADLRQREENKALDADLHGRAVAARSAYRTSPASQFQFDAFEVFVARCRAQHRLLVLCSGQLNPLQSRELDPELHRLLQSFLARLAARYDNVVVVGEPQLPAQIEADYKDLTHVNTEARERYTEALAPILAGLTNRVAGAVGLRFDPRATLP